MKAAFACVQSDKRKAVTLVGHRVVHGGSVFTGSVVIDEKVISEIETLSPLAPLRNRINLAGIREAMRVFPDVPYVAVFDTSFHHTLPPYAYLYGLPYEFFEEDKVRRYGFHGMSHSYVSRKAAEYLKRPFNSLEIVSCHLGNDASVCAVDHGRSVDTSMGFSPFDGLLMGTRSGSVDPGALIHIARAKNMTPDDLDKLLNESSGLKGISGFTNGMREIESKAAEGDSRAILAVKSFAYQVKKYIGAYAAAMAGLDVLVFTGGIGEKSVIVRSLACQGLGFFGITLDEAKNKHADPAADVFEISAINSQIKVLVVRTDEERMVAREALDVINRSYVSNIIRNAEKMPIPVEVSAHHIHLSAEHIDALFGKGYALMYGLCDKDFVRIRIEGDRELVFGDALVRVSPQFRLVMQIDTDEGNAANIKTGAVGHIDGIQGRR